ncbi:MAG TPA: aminotransferase class V-fold PLP-dependent enzyme [Candidatus Gracilibacteria bacterium]|nr:aminotransferase class V-fold PLP-dependent enzyme [Candidatus Gracilibacteria bacterium]
MINTELLRPDFPFFQKHPDAIFLDSACMSLRPQIVIDEINRYYQDYGVCAGRSHYRLSEELNKEILLARQKVGQFIGTAKYNQIVFSKNTTESINLVAYSFPWQKGDIVLCSDKEHNSNLLPWQMLVEKHGVELKIISSNSEGTLDLVELEQMISPQVKMLAVSGGSNLDGTHNDLAQISQIIKPHHIFFLVDGAQLIPHQKIQVEKLGIDALAFSSHKMLGPQLGVLYLSENLSQKLQAFLRGGSTVAWSHYDKAEFLKTPACFEAGLQDYAGIMGLAKAIEYLEKIGLEEIQNHEIKLNTQLSEGLARIGHFHILGPQSPISRHGICSLVSDKLSAHQIALMLDDLGNIMVRSGQHCVHSWFHHYQVEGSARVSFYLYNNSQEIDNLLEKLQQISKLI